MGGSHVVLPTSHVFWASAEIRALEPPAHFTLFRKRLENKSFTSDSVTLTFSKKTFLSKC